MNTTIPDLWPDFGTSPEPSPVSILRQQSYLLGQRTQNYVIGEIVSKTEAPGQFLHQFYLTAPLLEFRQALLHVRHGLDFYPVELVIYKDDMSWDTTARATDAKQFMSELKQHLASERIVRLVRSLVDQCREPEEAA